MKNITFKILLAVGCFGIAAMAPAQTRVPIDITINAPGNTPPTWVSLSGFTGEAESLLRFDLYVQGFNFTNAENAQFQIVGSNNGNFQGQVTDPHNRSAVVKLKGYSGGTIVQQVHTFVDEFTKALQRGEIAATKIAFKRDTGANSEIFVADFDGNSPTPVTADNTIVAAPTWAPKELALYYTSYKLGNPDIFFHNLSSGQRRVFSRYSGLNTAAAASASGKVAMILSKGGSPDVYDCNADGSGLLRLTKTREDESSPCWSPDGEWICYATKVNSRRVLQKMRATGGAAQTVSTSGALNPSEPDWSPDGKWIAFTEQLRDFQICVVPANGGPVTELVAGEDPSWAPNSRTLICTRREGGRRVLSLLDVPTKQYKDVSRITGSNSQPSWAK
jgi:TolB protein